MIDRCIGRKPSMERNRSGRSSKGGQRQKYLVCVNLIVVNFLKTVLNNSCGLGSLSNYDDDEENNLKEQQV